MEPAGERCRRAARRAIDALGRPDLGVVLGSGFGGLAGWLPAGAGIAARELPGYPAGTTDGHDGRIVAADLAGRRVWLFGGRIHLYEGFGPDEAAFPVTLLAAAGARGVVLTCAAGGIAGHHRPGDLVLVVDHLNLTGADPLRAIPVGRRSPAFLDLHDLYDGPLAEAWRRAADECGAPLGEGVLAALPGPCYETPAEVRMLRTLGADLASMSVVPEAIAARYHGLRTAALACVANRAAGLDGDGPIDHDAVLRRVSTAVETHRAFLLAGLRATAGALAAPGFDAPSVRH